MLKQNYDNEKEEMAWMYQHKSMKSENLKDDYLLGKKIDDYNDLKDKEEEI